MAKTAYTDVQFKKIGEKENYAWSKLFEFITPEASVLDVGCSSGNFGKELIKRKQCTVVGIDVNRDDLKVAAGNLTKTALKNIETDNLDDLGTFDYVLMADVIEHLVNPVEVLEKVKKLLKADGKLVFSVPNMANIATRLELLGGRFEYTKFGLLDETHIHYYDRIELEKVMSRAGFEIKEYNNTIRDVPVGAILTQLKKIGLSASDKFTNLASNMDSITFQFIGVAEPVAQSARQAKVASKTPHDFLSQQFDDLNQMHNQRFSELEGRLKMETQEKQRLGREVQRLDRELRGIHNSKGWRALSVLRGVKIKIMKVFGQK